MKKYIKVHKRHSWTKQDISMVAKLWETKTAAEIADEMGVEPQQVSYIASEIRKVYPNLIQKKYSRGYLRTLITETLGK